MDGEIFIRLPINGKITVSAVGKGKSKIRAVEMYEQIDPRLKKVYKHWYEMQFGMRENG